MQPPPSVRCSQCGYELSGGMFRLDAERGFTTTCPECGTIGAVLCDSVTGSPAPEPQWRRSVSFIWSMAYLALLIGILVAILGQTVRLNIRSADKGTGRYLAGPLASQGVIVFPQARTLSWRFRIAQDFALLGALAGVALACLFRHRSSRWRVMALVAIPVFASVIAVVISIWQIPNQPAFVAELITVHTVVQIAFGVVAFLLYRPVLRFVVRPLLRWSIAYFLPPSAAWNLRYFWTVDGLALPVGNAARITSS